MFNGACKRVAPAIAGKDGYIELAAVPNFNRKFAEATYLGCIERCIAELKIFTYSYPPS